MNSSTTHARGFPLPTVAVLTHAGLLQMLTYAFRPTLAYAALAAGAHPAYLGVLVAAFAIPALLLALPVGRLADRLGERAVGLVGGVLFTVAAVTAALGRESQVAIVIAALILGCGHLLSVVSEQTQIANRPIGASRDSAFGIYTLAASAGQTLGPLILIIPDGSGGGPAVALILWICAGIGAALTVVSVFLVRTPAHPSAAGVGMLGSARLVLVRPGAWRALLASSLTLATIDVTLVYWPALGEERDIPAIVISGMLVARSLATVASRVVLGIVVRRFGRRIVMVGSIALAAGALAATAIPAPPVVLIAVAAAYGVFVGVCQPVTMAWLSELAPVGQRGMTMSLRLAGNRLGQAVIPITVGALAVAAGSGGVLVAVAVSLLVATWAGAAVPPVAVVDDPIPID